MRRRGRRQIAETKPTFWGRAALDLPLPGVIRPSDDPTAVVRSLGPPRLGAGRESAAENYMTAVYGKAVSGATALAAAAGLLDLSEE